MIGGLAEMIAQYLAVAGIVFGVNLLSALGPPTWAVLVLFKLHWNLDPAPLVLVGAVAAGLGRFLLATATRQVRGRLSAKSVANLRANGAYVMGHKARSVGGLALFAVSPLPSAQLFEAAGLLDVPLLPLTVAFFVGRLVSYSIYIGVSSLAEANLGQVFRSALTSPYSWLLEIALLVGLVLLARVDWADRLNRRRNWRAGGKGAT
jgi:hypothetical protein